MLSALLSSVATDLRRGRLHVELILGGPDRTIRVSSEGELRAQLDALARAGWELTAVRQDAGAGPDEPMATLEFVLPTV